MVSNIGASTIAFALALSAATVPACEAAPQEIPIAIREGAVAADPRQISDYVSAVDAIMRVITEKFALTAPPHTLQIYPSREEFESGLIRHLGLDPALARSTASFAKAAVGGERVLVNEVEVAGLSWVERIELLAHELTHTVQFGLTGHRGLNRQQWLTEGFAEWMAYAVTDTLALDSLSEAQARIVAQLRTSGGVNSLPRLAQLDTFAQWIAARRKYGYAATFSLSFLAVEFLMKRHSFGAVLAYFRRFRESGDYGANFRAAFGESLQDFDAALVRHLASTLG